MRMRLIRKSIKNIWQIIVIVWLVFAYLQIPAHLTTHSAKSRSVFPDITERVSASADQ